MKTWLLALFGLLFASMAFAGPPKPPKTEPGRCDFTVSGTVYYDSEDKTCDEGKYCEIDSIVPPMTLYDISEAMTNDLNRRGLGVIDQASREQEKGGKYAMDFEQSRTCGGKTERMSGVRVEGVTFAGGNRIARKGLQVMDGILAQEERRHAQGGKRAWGKKEKKDK